MHESKVMKSPMRVLRTLRLARARLFSPRCHRGQAERIHSESKPPRTDWNGLGSPEVAGTLVLVFCAERPQARALFFSPAGGMHNALRRFVDVLGHYRVPPAPRAATPTSAEHSVGPHPAL